MATLMYTRSSTTDPSVLRIRSVSGGYLSSLSFLPTAQLGYPTVYSELNYRPICPGVIICQLWLPLITKLPSDNTTGYPPVYSQPNYRLFCPGDQICQLWLPLITDLPSD
jgi:hypothetical protein